MADATQFYRPDWQHASAAGCGFGSTWLLLVLLVTAAAAYAVFLRPFQDLVINAGGLILGIWGIRSILTPSSVQYVTAVDLSLAVVILFLLGAITLRAMVFLYQRSGLQVPWLFRKR